MTNPSTTTEETGPISEEGEKVHHRVTCRVYAKGTQVTHLVPAVNGRPHGDTVCGLTRFDNSETGRIADLPGWSIGGGVFGPNVKQVDCEACHA